MDSRLFYAMFHHALGSAVWDRTGWNEYTLVGDGIVLYEDRLQALVSQSFGEGAVLYYPESRRQLLEIPSANFFAFLTERQSSYGAITVSDATSSTFLQVVSNGVARTGRASLQPGGNRLQ